MLLRKDDFPASHDYLMSTKSHLPSGTQGPASTVCDTGRYSHDWSGSNHCRATKARLPLGTTARRELRRRRETSSLQRHIGWISFRQRTVLRGGAKRPTAKARHQAKEIWRHAGRRRQSWVSLDSCGEDRPTPCAIGTQQGLMIQQDGDGWTQEHFFKPNSGKRMIHRIEQWHWMTSRWRRTGID